MNERIKFALGVLSGRITEGSHTAYAYYQDKTSGPLPGTDEMRADAEEILSDLLMRLIELDATDA